MIKYSYILFCMLLPQLVFAVEGRTTEDSLAGNRIFGVDLIHEVRITFLQSNPWDSLYRMKKERDSLEIKRYMQANVEVNGIKYYSSGVRIKGESSFDFYPGNKKSFKINFGKFVKKQKLDGLKTINLNNAFRDPSFMREKLYLDFMRREGLPVPRCTYANVYVNKEYLGFYLLVEEVDKGFLKRNFKNKKGAFFKGEPKASLSYLGENSIDYQFCYTNKNKKPEDYLHLIELIKSINSIPGEDVPCISEVFNIEDCLKIFAVTNLFVNVDAYNMLYGHNYYLYKNLSTQKFEWIPYDGNYAFCAFSPGFSLRDAEKLSVFYMYKREERPLLDFLFRNEKYRKYYLAYINFLLKDKFTEQALNDEINELTIKIRRSVYYDHNKMYSNSEFEKNINTSLGNDQDPGDFIPGIKAFLRERIKAVKAELKNKMED